MKSFVWLLLYLGIGNVSSTNDKSTIFPSIAPINDVPSDPDVPDPTDPPEGTNPPQSKESNKVASNNTCTMIGMPSRTPPVALTFCDMYRTDSCCDPAIDVEIQGYYDQLIRISPLCGAQRTKAHIALQYIFCYACSPKEPRYTDNDAQTITFCSSIANDADPANFDDCGLLYPGERGALCSGDDVVIPTLYYGTDKKSRLEQFFNDAVGGIPPYFEDYTVLICDPTDVECESRCYDIDAGVSFLAGGGRWVGSLALSIAVSVFLLTLG